jgi:hypothetical protein
MKGQQRWPDPNSRAIPGSVTHKSFFVCLLINGCIVMISNTLGIDALKGKQTISQY